MGGKRKFGARAIWTSRLDGSKLSVVTRSMDSAAPPKGSFEPKVMDAAPCVNVCFQSVLIM